MTTSLDANQYRPNPVKPQGSNGGTTTPATAPTNGHAPATNEHGNGNGHDGNGRLDLHFAPGLSAYAFTFG